MSNVDVRPRTLEGDVAHVVALVRSGVAVQLAESDRLVQEGFFVQNVPVTEDRIKFALELLERETLYREGYGRPDSVQLPDRYERWGFTCTVSRKADLATVFFFGTPVMTVTVDEWAWLLVDASAESERTHGESGQNAADALENYGEFPVTEEQREEGQGYGICGLADLIQETWLR